MNKCHISLMHSTFVNRDGLRRRDRDRQHAETDMGMGVGVGAREKTEQRNAASV